MRLPRKLAIVFGTEAVGCTREMLEEGSDLRVYLPLRGFADSLNLSVATALVLHQLFVLDPTVEGDMEPDEHTSLRRQWFGIIRKSRSIEESPPVPLVEPKAEESPSFGPKAEESPSFEPKAEESPSFEPKAEESPSFEPKAEAGISLFRAKGRRISVFRAKGRRISVFRAKGRRSLSACFRETSC